MTKGGIFFVVVIFPMKTFMSDQSLIFPIIHLTIKKVLTYFLSFDSSIEKIPHFFLEQFHK